MGGCQRSLNIASPEDVVTLIFAVAYRIIQKGGGEWGDVNVHCSASPEDVVTLIFVLAYRRRGGGWGMLTFLALRHQKMLLR